MELLEREGALDALDGALASAARGSGRVVVLRGEPGIGKTSVVERFAEAIDGGTRLLVGTCDDLTIARPLGPFSDLVGSVSTRLESAIVRAARPEELHPLLLDELDVRSRPTVLVLEDVHWADEATLDAVTFLERRIGALPLLLVLTMRSGEIPPDHALHGALAAIPAGHAVFVELAPLSAAAVAALAGDHDAPRIFAATGGNPFYVRELVEFRQEGVPPSVIATVAGRTSRLDAAERRLVELVAVVPRRISTSLLDAAFPDWPAAAAEPERRQLLEVGPQYVRFRHELVRHAVHTMVPVATRRTIHAEILRLLLESAGDPADIVHHAERAGADDVVADHAVVAARRAAAAGANREAYAHYHRALDFLGRLAPEEQARVLEEVAAVAQLVNRLADAIAAAERAVDIWRKVGDRPSIGRCTRVLSRVHWYAGNSLAGRMKAAEAVSILEPLGESRELAAAYSGLARLSMVAADPVGTRRWAERALDLATRLRDDESRVETLVTLATLELQSDPSDVDPLLEARALAERTGLYDEAARAIANLGNVLITWGRPSEAFPALEEAVAYAAAHEIQNMRSYAEANLAWLHARNGDWEAAEQLASGDVQSGASVARIVADTVLAEIAVRRGDADVDARLERLLGHVDEAGDAQRVLPLLDLLTERALTVGTSFPTDRLEPLLRASLLNDRMALRVAATAALCGVAVEAEGPASSPYTYVARRDWRTAAAAFGDAGWSYDRALMLSLLEDGDALAEAHEIARALGAEPLRERVARQMRRYGLRVPRGPYRAARSNAAGLTARQLEVLRLVVEGRTNAEIANELVVSPRTVEHHVAALLTKLGATSRHDAARRAAALGLFSTAS